jgi:hypothetical protein
VTKGHEVIVAPGGSLETGFDVMETIDFGNLGESRWGVNINPNEANTPM